MRAATLVGVASIPVGFLWIHLFGTGSATVLLLASALAGVVYSGRSVPAYRAGARVGLFAPAPEVIVQILSGIRSLLASGLGRDATVVLLGFFVLVAGPALWVIGASLCVLCTAVAGWLVDLTRPYLPRPIGR